MVANSYSEDEEERINYKDGNSSKLLFIILHTIAGLVNAKKEETRVYI